VVEREIESRGDQRRPTATLTASSSSLRPQEVMGSANNQSPVCGARNEAHSNGELRLDSTMFLSAVMPGRSQNGYLGGRGSGIVPKTEDR